jgi:SAM-dependent methyltransferase
VRAEHYYQSLPGYFDFPDVYRHAVEWLPDGGTFVEVGCWQGQSLSFFLVEAFNSGKKLKVFGVDHFTGSVGDGPLLDMAESQDIESLCRANVARAGYPVEIIRAESVIGASLFADASIDYVFIDASHDGESVRQDLAAWLPKVKPGGIMAGHDYNQTPVQAAVDAAFPGRKVEHVYEHTATTPHGYQWGTCWRVQL